MNDQTHAVKIAVLDEQMNGLREQQKAHNEAAQKRFDEMDKKLDGLIAIMNRGKGAYAASMAFAGAIGALVLTGISWASNILHAGPK